LPHSNPHTALDQLELPHKHPGSPSLFKESPQQHCRDSAFCPHRHTTLGQRLGRNLEKTRKATNPRKTPVPKLTPHYTRSRGEDQRRKNQTAFKEERSLPKHWLTPMGGVAITPSQMTDPSTQQGTNNSTKESVIGSTSLTKSNLLPVVEGRRVVTHSLQVQTILVLSPKFHHCLSNKC
jgi:hypothetical protein